MHPTHCRHVLRHPSAALISYFPPPTTISRKCRRYATVVQDQDQQKASSSKPLKNPFPYPEHSRPTPYQIFHLASGATQAEIKARYYELVKTHHPDSHHAAHLDSEVAHARFRGIQAAYDFLRGKTVSPHLNARPAPPSGASSFDPYLHEMARRRRAYYSRHGDPFGEEEEEKVNWKDRFDGRTIWHEDGWRERLVFGLGVVTLMAGLFPSMPSKLANTFLPSSSVHQIPPRSSTPDGTPPPAATVKAQTAYNIPFIDLDRGHREAVSALVTARHERETYGAERREGVRKRVQEMTGVGNCEVKPPDTVVKDGPPAPQASDSTTA